VPTLSPCVVSNDSTFVGSIAADTPFRASDPKPVRTNVFPSPATVPKRVPVSTSGVTVGSVKVNDKVSPRLKPGARKSRATVNGF